MKILRAVTIASLLWIIMTLEITLLKKYSITPGDYFYIIHYFTLATTTLILSLIYFRKREVKKGVKQGINLGIIIILTTIILDYAIIYQEKINNLYTITSYLEILILTTVIGIIRK